MNHTQPLPPQWDRLQQRALLVGVVSLGLCLGGAWWQPAQFFHSYLLAYLFWLGIALGSLAIVMLHHLTGGAWGLIIRRTLEASSRTLPLLAVLFVPLLFGLADLYSWARPDLVAGDELLQHKSPYLNVPFFVLRAILYFAVWLGLAYWVNQWSLRQDHTADPALARRLETLSGPGLVLYGGTVTFASFDWGMSLEPHWFSTIYGVMFMVGHALTALAFAIIVVMLLVERQPFVAVVTPAHLLDLGNLLLAFVVLWAYIAFSQFLIIWSGNLVEEIPWYMRRLAGGWQWIAVFLLVFHFALPFLLLLSRRTKRNLRLLATVAVGLLVVHLLDVLWLVAPAFHQTGLSIHWMDIVAPIGIGGVWLARFIQQFKARALLPLHDPYLEDAFGHLRTV